ncbi:MAG TPA: PAS domain-containing sensor histidine kinase, partial [Acidobacteriota bacterium]|nr:PAS domain-containing sensor histidine kinase [Acidobacteriota bacterium]
QVSARLEQLEDQFVKAFRSSPVVLVISRVSDGNILEVNDRFEALLGYSRPEVIGKTSTELGLYDPGLRPVLLKQLDEQGYLRDYELDLCDRWGNMLHTSVSFEQISLNSEACLLICVQDQTELKKADLALQELTARLLKLQDEERRRIARELHDVTAQNISAISLNLAYLQKCLNLDDERPARAISESIELAEQVLKEIRTLSYVLHPPLLDQSGLVPALQWYIDGFSRRSGVAVDFKVMTEIERLDPEIETTLFRVVQEGLTNVYRHSGSSSARIRLLRDGDFIKLQIKDQGKGISFDEASAEPQLPGVGIPGMRQRIRQIGGQLELISSPKGTVVTAIVPIKRN